ncbi:hypothetical protein BDR05DRAFT_998998 [Suillus weaverae]|nr:hypothetical protein BDR05DRAFT_998998 [Suillus weaverae]
MTSASAGVSAYGFTYRRSTAHERQPDPSVNPRVEHTPECTPPSKQQDGSSPVPQPIDIIMFLKGCVPPLIAGWKKGTDGC